MRTLALLAAGLLAAGVALAQPVERRYVVTFQGEAAGELRWSTPADGRAVIDYRYRDNGRGPDIHEEIALAPDGRMLDYRSSGSSTFGAPLGETFTRRDGRVAWTSPADRGEGTDDGRGVYIPIEASPVAYAFGLRALLQAPQATARAWPAGQLTARRLVTTQVESAGRTADVALYAVSGVQFFPLYTWLREDGSGAFFADMYPGYQTIEAGFESAGARLLELQQAADGELRRSLAERLRHPADALVVIRGARIFDAPRARSSAPRDVHVRGGRIVALRPAGSPIDEGATVIDGRGHTLLPGLFDMHGHEWSWNAMLQVAGGVTTVRDMGSQNDDLQDLMQRIDAGQTLGPRIVPAGFIEGDSPFSSRGGIVVKNEADALAAVDWYADHGYRQVKLYNSMKPAWVPAVAARAHARGLRVSGHVPAFMRAEQAVRAGYDELQHINQVMLNFLVSPTDDTRTLLRFSLVGDKAGAIDLGGPAVRRFVALLREHRVAVDPTAAAFEAGFLQRSGEPNPTFAAVADHLPAAVQRGWRFNSTDLNDANAARYRAAYARMLGMIGLLHRSGITLLAGTDDIAGFTLHRELELYVKAGIPAGQALRIATWNGAQAAGLGREAGRIEVGRRAELTLVQGDPVRRIEDIRRVALVMRDGALWYPAEIYEALGVRRFADPPPVVTAPPRARR